MANRTSYQALTFDKQYLRDLMGAPVTNHARLAVVTQALRDAIEHDLTPRQREMVMLRYFEHKSNLVIARELGVSPSCVSRTLQRARENLQHSLRFYVEYLNCHSLE